MIDTVLQAALPAKLQITTTPVALSAVAEVWGHGNSDSRLVFTV